MRTNKEDIMKSKITIEYDQNIPDLLQESSSEFEKEAKMAMAAKLFELKRISSGTAAAMVNMDRVSFLLNLHNYNVNVIDLNPRDMESDLKNA